MRAYHWLLHLYPASFRGEYGDEMQAVFAERLGEARGLAVGLLWLATVLDVVGNATAVHWDLLRQDLRHGARNLRRTPAFAGTAVLVIGLGIGATAAAFSIADVVFFRPIPFRAANRLVTVWEDVPGYSMMQPSPANYRDWARLSRAFSRIGAYHNLSATLLGGGSPQQVDGIAVHGALFGVLGVAPMIGHLPSADEIAQGAPVVVLSYGLWNEDFGADRGIVGRVVTLNGSPYTIAGVMPRSFAFPDRTARLWMPMRTTEVNDDDRGNNWFYVVGELAPGRTLAQAKVDMDGVAAQLRRIYPADDSVGATVLSLRDTYYRSSTDQGRGRTLLEALCGAALCVLLITCANLASLLLVRAMGRRRELAVRAALGAGRERLVRQLITESLMLALIGGACGVGLAYVAMPLLNQLVPATLPMAQLPTVDVRVLALAALLSILTGVGFGVVPAIRAGRASSLDGLRDGVRSGMGRTRLRSILVAVEVAVSVALLASAGLLLRAAWRVRAIDPGFRQEQVMTLRTELPAFRYWKVATRTTFYRSVLDRVRAIPGVTSAGYISFLPMTMGGGIWAVSIPPDTGFRHASLRFITPGYLDAMRIPLLRGRGVTDGDTRAAPLAAVVSESFAKRFWPGRDPIGQHFGFAFGDRTVIGVVHDVRVRGPERESEPQVYLPDQQMQDSALSFYAPRDLAIRSSLPAATLLPMVRRIIHSVDAEQPISDVRSMSTIVDAQLAARTAQVRLVAAFAAIAFLLAAIGMHGVLAITVSERRREISIRMALGAQTSSILRMVFRQGAVLAVAGVLPGLLVAMAAGRAMQSVLAGVPPDDATTFVVVTGLAVVMVGLGTWLPARRAMSVQPASAMRGE
jgi:putative ABC transport system permease protein